MDEGGKIVSRVGCLSPATYVLRENLNRFLFGNAPMSGEEVTEVFALMEQARKDAATRKKAEREAKEAAAEARPKTYPYLTEDAEPFLRGCVASHTMGGEKMDGASWLRCGCFEFAAQKLGNEELYLAFVRNFDEVYYRSRGREIRRFNGIANTCLKSPTPEALEIIGTYRGKF